MNARWGGWRLALVAVSGIAIGVAIYSLFSWVDFLGSALRQATASSSHHILVWLGWTAALDGTTLVVPASRFLVSTECTPLAATAFLWGAVLAFPGPWRGKALGLVLGALLLFAVNALRVVSLVYVVTYHPDWLDTVHLLVWQTLMVLLALALFLVWTERFASPHQA